MPNIRLIQYLSAIALLAGSLAVIAEEVSLEHEGLTLNANFQLAEGKSISDGVILITHGALEHRDTETIIYFSKLLHARGYNTLAINLSLGLNHRRGIYDCQQPHRHTNEDAVDEIGLWLNWLKTQGANRVVLLGHSRGGAQTALFAAERHTQEIKSVVLLAPAIKENTDTAAYQLRYGMSLAPLLDKARKMVAAGQGEQLLENIGLLTCGKTSATANSFLSYYGQASRVDTPSLLPAFKVPTLIIVAGGDNVVVELDRKIASLVDGKRVKMALVTGADHMFRDLYADDAVEAIDEFLQSLQSEVALQHVASMQWMSQMAPCGVRFQRHHTLPAQ